MPRTGYITIIMLMLSVLLAQNCSAKSGKTKTWTKLDDCRYLDNKSNDGDSFYVMCGTNEFIARLYFVDSPETDLHFPDRTQEQSEYFGVTIDAVMKAGRTARDTVRELLQEHFIIHTRKAIAGGRSAVPRYYSFVEVGGQPLAETLVSLGLARVKGVITNLPDGENWRAYNERLRTKENEARQKQLGAWAGSTVIVPASPKVRQ